MSQPARSLSSALAKTAIFVMVATMASTGTLGVSNVRSRAPMSPRLHMRIASVAKAFSGAVSLALVDRHGGRWSSR